jgi:hypothetical protein
MPSHLKSALITLLILSPSLLLGIFLIGDRPPVPYAYFVSCTILLLAAIDFATVVFIEQYRRRLGALTIPAFLGTIFIILMFVIAASLNRFFEHLGYGYMTPFAFAALLLVYAAAFREKNIALKCYLSLNSIALALLWAMGTSDKITMPF